MGLRAIASEICQKLRGDRAVLQRMVALGFAMLDSITLLVRCIELYAASLRLSSRTLIKLNFARTRSVVVEFVGLLRSTIL